MVRFVSCQKGRRLRDGYAAVLLLLPAVHSGSAGAAIVPPQNPGSNISPAPGYVGPCGSLAAAEPLLPERPDHRLYGDRQVEGRQPHEPAQQLEHR